MVTVNIVNPETYETVMTNYTTGYTAYSGKKHSVLDILLPR